MFTHLSCTYTIHVACLTGFVPVFIYVFCLSDCVLCMYFLCRDLWLFTAASGRNTIYDLPKALTTSGPDVYIMYALSALLSFPWSDVDGQQNAHTFKV